MLSEGRASVETIDDVPNAVEIGPALVAHALATAFGEGRTGMLVHTVDGRDGVSARSKWSLS